MSNFPDSQNTGTIVYYGNSDLIGQIADELIRNPDSCFALNVLAWYDALYSATPPEQSCSYQVLIDQDKCETQQPSTVEDLVDILVSFTQGKSVRVARVALRVACREANRLVGVNNGAENN